jgi:hypothetical protein
MKKIVLGIGIIIAAVFPFAAFAQLSDMQPAAVVNLTHQQPITVREYRQEISRTESQAGRSLSSTEKQQLLNSLINDRLAQQAAARDHVTVTADQVNQQIIQMRSQASQQAGRQLTDGEFMQLCRQNFGVDTMPALQDEVKKQLTLQQYLMFKEGDIIRGVKEPTESEIEDFFDKNRTNFVQPQSIRFSSIIAPYGTSDGSTPTAAAKRSARAIIDRVASQIGGDAAKFDEAVQKAQAGNLDYKSDLSGFMAKTDQAVQQAGSSFVDAAFKLKQGQVSKVLELDGPGAGSAAGYWIIKVTSQLPLKLVSLDDPWLQTNNRMTVHDYIKAGLEQQKQAAALQEAQTKLIKELRGTDNQNFTIYENNIKGI